jgi:aminopeptidase YwaD
MHHGLRAAAAAALVGAWGALAGPAAAAPPMTYDQEIVSQYNAANSYETVRHLAVDIGPRRSGTPEELEGATYLKGILDNLGFQTTIYAFPITGNGNNRAVAKVKSPNATLPNGPNWQFSSSVNGKQTGVANPVTADVVYAGTGVTTAPDGSDGKIVVMDQAASTTARLAQVNSAIAKNAVGVVLAANTLGTTGIPAAPPSASLSANVNIPVMGAGRSHLDWMKALLAAGPLSLTFTTENYLNPTRAVVVGRRFAVGDPTGTTAPIVMVGAHIDSVLGSPGGHDDASGNGVSMEIARVVSKLPLDKEIRIGGFGGEEDGLTGSRAYMQNIVTSQAERARFVGEWQMDMVGTPYAPAELWALVPDGQRNFVVDQAYKAADRVGFAGLQNCFLGQSDHQAFFDVGIPSALFIWLNYRKPALPRTCTSGPFNQPDYTTEPEYHRPMDGMNNVSAPRMQTVLDVVGGAFAHNALNRVDLTSNRPNAAVIANCGDGVRTMGTTDANGALSDMRFPHATCTFTVAGASRAVSIVGDTPVSIAAADVSANATVPATLSLSLGTPAAFGAFTPGLAKDYTSSMTATVVSTAGNGLLSVADPSANATGKLVNGTFSLVQTLQAKASSAAGTGGDYLPVGGSASPTSLLTYANPTSNDAVTVGFKQTIGANEPLRTGSYSKTLTFTLSTTAP